MKVRRRGIAFAVRPYLVPAFLVLGIVLGGASAAGLIANLALQLLAIALGAYALARRGDASAARPMLSLLVMTGLLVALFALQLAPLPPGFWTALPGRETIASGLALLGVEAGWRPLSLAPARTLLSLWWLLPAFAMLLLGLRAGFRLTTVAWTLAGAAVVSVLLGAIQLAGGADSPAYLYRFTNYGAAVGFFANANHLGTLLLATIPFIAALMAGALRGRRRKHEISALALLCATVLAVIVVGLVITGSLAAIGLAAPVAGASLLLLRAEQDRPTPRWALPAVLVIGIAALAVVMSQPFGNNLTGANRADAGSRRTAWETTLSATADYWPAGTGIGTFPEVYRRYEDPASVGRVYMNHAHSDPLEIVLETGVLGLALMASFLLWWGLRVSAIWRSPAREIWTRAATIASGAMMAHSVVDYPLRTAALSVLFAYCLALMAGARAGSREGAQPNDVELARHASA